MKRLGHFWLILALLAATGGHWAVLQSVAWTTMLAGNLRTSSLADAVERTFDGKHPCAICKIVAEGKQSEKKAELTFAGKELEFLNERTAFTFCAPSDFRQVPELENSGDQLAYRPPVPPPRGFFA